MTDAILAALSYPAGDNRRQRSGSRSRKRRKRGNVEHIHLVNSLLLANTASLPRLRKTSAALPRGQPIQLFASAGHQAGALFKNQFTGLAEIGLVLPQAVLDSGRVGNVASAEAEGVGCTRGPLLGGAAILLRSGGCRTKQC